MKKVIALISISLFCLYACNNEEKQENKEDNNDVNTVRYFIQSALNGDYQKARTYMIKDSANEEWMQQAERVAASLSPEEKKGYAGASIITYNIDRINDTATIVIYANSYKKNMDTLRVLKKGDQWLVDLKYLFTHDRDSLWTKPLQAKDSAGK